MTGIYSIKIGNAAVKSFVQFSYEHTLNGMSNSQIAIDGVTSVYAAEFDIDEEIFIYRSGTLVFRGIITDQKSLTGGGLVLNSQGIELELTDEKCPMVGTALTRVWTSTSDETIMNTLVTSISGWTLNHTNSASVTTPSFRVSATESVWNGIIRLIEQTGKDIWIDQTNKVVYLYDELTRASQFSFIEGKNAKNIARNKSRSKAGKVIVYGKGDGDLQIIGSYGASTPEKVIVDRNILTSDEADDRAESAYDKLNPQSKSYILEPTIISGSLRMGDAGQIANNSAKINEEVDIVRIKTTVNNVGTEKYNMEVTNPTYRLASKNNAEDRMNSEANYLQSQSSMQGSGNTMIWERGINAQSDASLRLHFNIPANFIEDQAGNLRVESFTVDYDVDPFRSDVGTAVTDSHDHDLNPGSTDSHKHDATNTSTHPHGIPSSTAENEAIFDNEGSDSDTSFTASIGWNDNVVSEAFSGTFAFLFVRVVVIAQFSDGDFDVGLRLNIDGTFWVNRFNMHASTGASTYVIKETFLFPIFASQSDTIECDIYSSVNQDYDVYLQVWGLDEQHSHDIDSFNTNGANANIGDSNKTPGLAGDTDNTAAGVSIGDDVSDAGSINASQVSLYLESWNGSAWISEHSILNTGATIDEDVDISDGGTYPDKAGWWRVRVKTDHASPDYVQTIVKIKHNLDNE